MASTSGAEGSEAASPASAREVCAYIAEITGELTAMARKAQLEDVARFLEMARFEADRLSRSPRPLRDPTLAKART